MNPSHFGRALVAVALLCLPVGCRTAGTAVGTAGRAAGATAAAAGHAVGTAAEGAGDIVEQTAKEADREVRGK